MSGKRIRVMVICVAVVAVGVGLNMMLGAAEEPLARASTSTSPAEVYVELQQLQENIVELKERLQEVDDKLEWQTTLSHLRSDDITRVFWACEAIVHMGKSAIPKLLSASFDEQPARHAPRLSGRTEDPWTMGVQPEGSHWTVGDLCLGIACSLVDYGIVYAGGLAREDGWCLGMSGNGKAC